MHLEENKQLRSIKQRGEDFKLFYPKLGDLPIEAIKRSQFTEVFDEIGKKRGPRRAVRAISSMKTLLSWHANRVGEEYVSKLAGWRAPKAENGRDRTLDDAEIKAVWLAAEQDQGPFAAFVRFTLLTATRRDESARLRRGELSADGTTWTIPGSRYKNKLDTVIPLSKTAQAIIASQPHLPHTVISCSASLACAASMSHAKNKTRLDQACGVTVTGDCTI